MTLYRFNCIPIYLNYAQIAVVVIQCKRLFSDTNMCNGKEHSNELPNKL